MTEPMRLRNRRVPTDAFKLKVVTGPGLKQGWNNRRYFLLVRTSELIPSRGIIVIFLNATSFSTIPYLA